ncbi:MAG: hypothetical protein ACK56F_25540 [bacterium]
MRIEHATHAFFFLPGIPWEDPDVTMSTKVGLFLHALDVLEVEVQGEAQLSLFYLVMAAMQLFRLLYATKAHPHIANAVDSCQHVPWTIGFVDLAAKLAPSSILFKWQIGSGLCYLSSIRPFWGPHRVKYLLKRGHPRGGP